MAFKKDKLQHILDDMPDKIAPEEVIDRLILFEKIEKSLEQSEQGLGEDFENFKKAWLKEN